MTDLDAPLLIIDRIEKATNQVCAEVRIAGRRERVALEMPGPDDGPYDKIISYDNVPEALSTNEFALRWIVHWLRRAHDGEEVRLPLDLSPRVREASEAWPVSGRAYAHMTERDGSSSSVEVIQTTVNAPGLTTVTVRVCGALSVVEVDERRAPHEPIRFRFSSGVHPWQLAPKESYAMLNAVVGAAP
jgi:hypothetical protein